MDEIGLKDTHFQLLEEKYGIGREKFEEMLYKDDDELEELFDKLVCEEVDDKLIEEIVDFIADYCNK